MKKITPSARRTQRVRYKLKDNNKGRPRLTVFRSNKNIFVQIIDDSKGVTIAAASTIEKELKTKLKGKSSNVKAATEIGTLIAERAKKANVKEVVFDRGNYIYHGRIKALAEAARAAGLAF